ncbi:sphingosine hydroxylase [Umbelopsis sp. PMI_123]|nr:sphingosine hydroxylase [Umbelopsis sp. PMI_123]
MNITTPVGSSYQQHQPTRLVPFMSDSAAALVAPLLVYWVYSLFFHFLSKAEIPWVERYRIHDPEEMTKNKVSVKDVIQGVVFQQVLQTLLGLLVLEDEENSASAAIFNLDRISWAVSTALRTTHINQLIIAQFGMPAYMNALMNISSVLQSYIIPAFQFFVAMFILDGYQYFFHRLFHQNRFLYKHIHSYHHRLYVPYAFGALYNHPVEGFVMDSVGATLAFTLSGLPTKGAIFFFAFSTLKTVDDHCGYAFPWDPLQFMFGNNVAYHDIHHQPFGIKKNYSQPFFTWWDRLLNTYVATDRVYSSMSEKVQVKDKLNSSTEGSAISSQDKTKLS